MKRTDIINYLINKNNYNKYLEIGLGRGSNFSNILCQTKHGVDPNYNTTYRMTSNQFFKTINKNDKYDIIFIDGDHRNKTVLKDINNSLNHLNNNGIILVHDVNPTSYKLARNEPAPNSSTWFGDGFKSIVKLRATNPYLVVRVIDTDFGIGLIKPTTEKQRLIKIPRKISYGFMNSNRKETLGLISLDEFMGEEI